jgi:hypothetical protein
MIGEHFNIYERNTDPNLVQAHALINIHSEKYELVPEGYHADEEPQYEHITSIEVTQEVKGGPFYSNCTQCIIVNGKNQILRLGGKYRFDVNMYRSLNDPTMFSIIFKDKEIYDRPEWISF